MRYKLLTNYNGSYGPLQMMLLISHAGNTVKGIMPAILNGLLDLSDRY